MELEAREFLAKASIEISYCVRLPDPHIEDEILVLDLKHTARVRGNDRRKRSGS